MFGGVYDLGGCELGDLCVGWHVSFVGVRVSKCVFGGDVIVGFGVVVLDLTFLSWLQLGECVFC